MKPVVLFLLIFPAALVAQQRDPSGTENSGTAAPAVAKVPTPADEASLIQTDSNAHLLLDPDSTAPQQQPSARPTPPAKPPGEPKPQIPGSMVGYIDNPIVESQIRIRFDAAFEDQFPDRSEFFYAKCGCYRLLPNAPGPGDPNAPGPGTGVPTAINFQQLYMDVEYSPQRRFSFFTEVPIRWLQPQGFQLLPNGTLIPGNGATPFPDESGISDVMAGFKFAAIASEGTYLTFQFKSFFPSGDSTKGLGTNHYSIEPSLLLYQKLSDRFTLEGQVGDWHPIGGSAGVPTTSSQGFAGDIFFYGIGPSYKLYRRNRVQIAPVLELFGWHVLSGLQTQPVTGPLGPGAAADASGIDIVNLKFGVRTSIGFHNSFYVGFGQAVTHDDWYKHIVRVEYRYTF